MVKSGLVDVVTVSHYRLAVHLITAIFIISIIFWLIINFNLKLNIRFFNFKKRISAIYFINNFYLFTNYNGSICVWFRCWKNISNLAINGE